MAIIETTIPAEELTALNKCLTTADAVATVICKGPDTLQQLMDAIKPGTVCFYLSDGDFSMQDMVCALVRLYRPAELFLSTYSLRETAVRQLIFAIERGDISSVNMLLDYRAPVRTEQVYQLAKENFARIFLINIHAKVTVIKTPVGNITIVGSQNWTVNPKIEAGVVSMSDDVAGFFIDHFKQLMDGAEIFE